MIPVGVTELAAPRILLVGHVERRYQVGWVGIMPQSGILNSLFMYARVMQKEGIEQNIQIAVAVDHAAEYRLH